MSAGRSHCGTQAVGEWIFSIPAVADEIAKREIDLVVMQTHGRKRLSQVLLGSVTERSFRCALTCATT